MNSINPMEECSSSDPRKWFPVAQSVC